MMFNKSQGLNTDIFKIDITNKIFAKINKDTTINF